MKKILSLALCLIMVIGIFPVVVFNIRTSAATWSSGYSDSTDALNEVKALMKSQTSSYNISRFNYILEEYPLSGYFNTKKTTKCKDHYSCGCGAKYQSTCIMSSTMTNFYDKETNKYVNLGSVGQCIAYGNYCIYRFFGKRITNGITVSSANRSSAANFKKYLDSFYDLTGTQFYVKTHSFTYLARDNTYIYFIDANSKGSVCPYCKEGAVTNCKIHLRRFTYSDFIGKYSSIVLYTEATPGSVPKLTIKYNANGGKISSDTYGLTGDGLVKTLSDGSTNIQIEEYGEYEKWGLYDYDTFGLYKDGYKFGGWKLSNTGKIYDMNTPWHPEDIYPELSKGSATITATAVWNPSLTIKYNANGGKISSEKAGTYYLAGDGMVKLTSGGSDYSQSPEYGKTFDNGFVDGVTLGLVREGYTFEGWSLAKSGSKVYTDTEKWKPEEVYPALKNGPATITAYAIWKKNECSFGAWQTTKPATCTTAGQQTRVCSVCSTVETKSISATGHKNGEWKTTRNATCTTAGQQTRVCSVCSSAETRAVSTKGHNYSSSYTTDKSATCTTAGSKSLHCTVCGVKTDVTTIASIGHSYGEWKTTKQPTTSKEGQAVRKCIRSGCEQSETKTIAKLAEDGHTHKYGEWEITQKATCTKDGHKKHTCTVCKEVETTAVSMIGHSFGNWYIAKPASQSENGIRERKCENCGATEKQTIEKLVQSTQQQIAVSSRVENDMPQSSNYVSAENQPQTSSQLDETSDTVSLEQESNTVSLEHENNEINASSETEGEGRMASPLWLIILVCILSVAVLAAGVVIVILVRKTKK